MKIIFHRRFKKAIDKLHKNEIERFKERKKIFVVDPFHPILNNHALHGKYEGYRSIDIGGDLRVVFKLLVSDVSLFTAIDTHSNLYK